MAVGEEVVDLSHNICLSIRMKSFEIEFSYAGRRLSSCLVRVYKGLVGGRRSPRPVYLRWDFRV